MSIILIFIWVLLAFTIMAFLEKTIEGPNIWGSKSYGWKPKDRKGFKPTEYHLLFWSFIAILATFPLVIYGFNLRLFGVLISAFAIGFMWEDFFYFIINPYFGLKKWNSKVANFYPWLKIGKFEFPILYLVAIFIALSSWYFLWR